MAGRKENIKALFTNTRSRVIIVFTVVLLVVAVVIGITQYLRMSSSGVDGGSSVSLSPAIQSIPGALNPTVQYAKLQEAQNKNQAQQALKTGGSAIPTIVRSQTLGAGVGVIGAQNGEAGVGFQALVREDQGGLQKSAWIQELHNSSCSRETVSKVLAEGAKMSEVMEGCTCLQLKDDGYKLPELQKTCSCKELKAAGFSARQLKDAGFNASRLKTCGFDACEMRNAGFTAQQMKEAGYTDGELKGAGFSDDEIARASGLPNGISAADVRKAGCQAEDLGRLRKAGVSASAIRRISGCSLEQLKAAGFTAADLKNAGFTAADLKNAGFTAAQLKQAGFTARDLLNAGFTPAALADAGYDAAQIQAAESELPPGITSQDVTKAGCDETALKNERLAGVSAKLIRKYAGCTPKALKAAGFTNDDLADAGFTPQQLAGISGLGDDAIKAAGCDPAKLKTLLTKGISAKQIHDLNGCRAADLKAAGYDAGALLDAGFTPQNLLAAGFTADQIKAAPNSIDDAIKAAGCEADKLKQLFTEGISAKRIHELNGCGPLQLKAAGYDAKSLLDAGFTPQNLLAVGFTPEQIKNAGINPAAAIASGRLTDCSVASLAAAHRAGVSALAIRDTLGCKAQAMKAAGYTATELRNGGFTAAELKAAGFSAAELKAAGFSARELKDAGFTAAELKATGFTATELKDAGFTGSELKEAGYTASELKNAGFTADELKAAGFTARELKQAGFTAKDLKEAGFSADQLRAAGYSPNALLDAGYTPDQIKNAGYSADELSADGINSQVAGLGDQGVGVNSASGIPPVPGYQANSTQANTPSEASTARELQQIMSRQQQQLSDQKYQQKIQQRTSEMLGAANQALGAWKAVATQTYTAGTPEQKPGANETAVNANGSATAVSVHNTAGEAVNHKALIKTGDILFAVIDTSVNSDEPGPILATVVTGRFKGAKLIGSFNLASNADKMSISFNTMSVPGANKSTSISAYAIDSNTARTALSSDTNHHYLMRYGALFASSFLEGFGNAVQNAGTTVTVGGAGGTGQVTVAQTQNNSPNSELGSSALKDAVIALATVGKNWGQVAQQIFNTPTTVQIYSGTGVGILFTQDLTSL